MSKYGTVMKTMNRNYAQECPHMRKMEQEAYLEGNMCFRDWEDGLDDKLQYRLTIAEHKFLKENRQMTVKIDKQFLKGLITKLLEEKAKGLESRKVIFKHALKNAFNPVITASSGWLGSMLAGAVFVEYVFGWNGIGKLVVDSLNQMDLPVLMGCVLVIAVFFVLINIIVDLIYRYLNPKITYS